MLTVLTLACLSALAAANCDPAEASGYTLVSKIYLPTSNMNWDTMSNIPASQYQEGSSTVPDGDISRVAYCVELNNKWVWTSFDHTDRSQVGIPVDYKIDGAVANLNVYDSEGKSITGSSGGKLEFWDECYGTSGGDSSKYDHDDSPSSANCYGSMQVHDGTQTEFGFNGWSHGSYCDITIGTSATAHKDGTFNQQCNNYQSGNSRSVNTYVKLASTACATTSCTYTDGHTHVFSKMLNDDGTANAAHERWHCEKSGTAGCECKCEASLKCTVNHHHTSGYTRSFDHC